MGILQDTINDAVDDKVSMAEEIMKLSKELQDVKTKISKLDKTNLVDEITIKCEDRVKMHDYEVIITSPPDLLRPVKAMIKEYLIIQAKRLEEKIIKSGYSDPTTLK